MREENALDGEVLKQWEIMFKREKDGTITFHLYEPDEIYLPVEEEPGPEPWEDTSSGYTAEEIAQMKKDQLKLIRDLDLKLRMDKVELERMKRELETGEIRAALDGTIVTSTDEQTARDENQPIVLLSGGGGYIVETAIGEFNRDSIHIGDQAVINSWESGASCTGEVVEITDTPKKDQEGFWSDGNNNISLYTVKIRILDDAVLREYEMVDLTYMNQQEGGGTGLYLENPYLREENGRSYVWVRNGDGKLEKRFVRTGRSIWGSYTQILDGLTMDDYIAFPYGRGLRDGARTVQQDDMSVLYM